MDSDFLEEKQAVVYLVAIGIGLAVGAIVPGFAESLEFLIYPVLGCLLLVTFLQVPFNRLAEATRDFRFIGNLMLVNFILVPPVAWALSHLVEGDAVKLGVLMVLLVPCIDYVIVFTRLAGGDSTSLLAATPLLMLIQIILLPFYLWLFLGSGISGLVEIGPFIETFLLLIVLPLGAAWLAQMAAGTKPGVARTVEASASLAVPLMAATLFVVVASQSPRVFDDAASVLRAVPVFLLFMAVMTVIGTAFGQRTGQPTGQARAVLFSGVTRNGLVVLPLALALDQGSALVAAIVVTQVLIEVIGLVALIHLVPRLVGDD